MTARVPAMLGIIRSCIKTKAQDCTIPGNNLCFKILDVLKQSGIIYGYSHIYEPRKKTQKYWHGYPRVKIFFKYSDLETPTLKDIKSYKNTRSNFLLLSTKNKRQHILTYHKLYLISTVNGLILTSFADLFARQKGPTINFLSGKIIAELLI